MENGRKNYSTTDNILDKDYLNSKESSFLEFVKWIKIMETKECKIHGIMPKTSEYFILIKKTDKRNRNKSGEEQSTLIEYIFSIDAKECVLEKVEIFVKKNVNNLNETYVKKCLKKQY